MAEDKEVITISYSLDDIDQVIKKIQDRMHEGYSIFTLQGSLGAGKTTLVNRLLRACGVTEVITSPTFTYVNKYTNAAGQIFYHFDLYRLSFLDEFMHAGFDEYLHEQNAIIFIEWSEIIEPLLQRMPGVCTISIDHGDNPEMRTIIIERG